MLTPWITWSLREPLGKLDPLTVLHLRWTGKNQTSGVGVRQWAHVGSLKVGHLLADVVEQVAKNLRSGEAEWLWEGTWEVIHKIFKLSSLLGFFSAHKNI